LYGERLPEKTVAGLIHIKKGTMAPFPIRNSPFPKKDDLDDSSISARIIMVPRLLKQAFAFIPGVKTTGISGYRLLSLRKNSTDNYGATIR
jgi:hypothetical protein